MALIIWSSTLNVNVKIFDDQHKKIVQYINELHDSFHVKQKGYSFSPLLNKLFAYVEDHLDVEEEYFTQYGYPQAAEHIEEHHLFIKKITAYKKQLEEEENKDLFLPLLDFLSCWLLTHIQETDMAYSKFFNEKNVF